MNVQKLQWKPWLASPPRYADARCWIVHLEALCQAIAFLWYIMYMTVYLSIYIYIFIYMGKFNHDLNQRPHHPLFMAEPFKLDDDCNLPKWYEMTSYWMMHNIIFIIIHLMHLMFYGFNIDHGFKRSNSWSIHIETIGNDRFKDLEGCKSSRD